VSIDKDRIVKVRRHWSDWKIAAVHFGSLRGFHWRAISGGIASEVRGLLYMPTCRAKRFWRASCRIRASTDLPRTKFLCAWWPKTTSRGHEIREGTS
jgi:hypothetical protein